MYHIVTKRLIIVYGIFFFSSILNNFFGHTAIQTHILVHWTIIVELILNYQTFLKSKSEPLSDIATGLDDKF